MTTSQPRADRAQQAIDFITSCCATVGAFRGTSDVHNYLAATATEMAAAKSSDIFPDRYIEHVAYALGMVAGNIFTTPPAATASVYLATRFEFYFRKLSGKLNADGTWISSAAQQAARSAINDSRLGRNRISSVALTYKIMKLNQSRPIVQHCTALDNTLYSTPTTVVGPMTVADIGDRIEFGRHAVGHGQWGDISSEAMFYGLMTSLVYYSKA